MQNGNCASCRWFMPHAVSTDKGDGTCHRYAPRPLTGGSGQGWSDWEWPKVYTGSFCGEFDHVECEP